MNRLGRSRHLAFVGLTLLALAVFSAPIVAETSDLPLPVQVTGAKTIYLDNETGTQAVLDTASEEFGKWKRFTIVTSKSQADLVVVFVHKNGLDLIGNAGFIKMEVFAKGSTTPAYEVKKSFRNIFQPQLRAKNCVVDFRKRLEGKI